VKHFSNNHLTFEGFHKPRKHLNYF